LLINEVKEPKKGKPEFIKLNLLRIPFRLGFDVFATEKLAKKEKNGD
jgi:exopolyphosphatase/guanosine-5'-triphosphate,3'-diphosphate pyrophosphatase